MRELMWLLDVFHRIDKASTSNQCTAYARHSMKIFKRKFYQLSPCERGRARFFKA